MPRTPEATLKAVKAWAEQGARDLEKKLGQRARTIGLCGGVIPIDRSSPLRPAQLIADEPDELDFLIHQVVPAPDHEPGGPEHDQRADNRKPPAASDREQIGETAHAGVQNRGEEQAGEDEKEGASSAPGQEQASACGERNKDQRQACPKARCRRTGGPGGAVSSS